MLNVYFYLLIFTRDYKKRNKNSFVNFLQHSAVAISIFFVCIISIQIMDDKSGGILVRKLTLKLFLDTKYNAQGLDIMNNLGNSSSK